jgi:hypothetical protein
VRDFRRSFLQTLTHIKSAYPSARISADEQGLTLEHSPPPVAPRYISSVLGTRPSHGKFVAPPAEPPATDSLAGDSIEAAPKFELTP